MANGLVAEITVRRHVKNEWYVYTCETMPGLYVASKDDKLAYNDVPVAVQKLIKLDLGVDCRVTHTLSYPEFAAHIRLSERARENVRERTDAMVTEAESDYFRFSVQHLGKQQSNHDIATG